MLSTVLSHHLPSHHHVHCHTHTSTTDEDAMDHHQNGKNNAHVFALEVGIGLPDVWHEIRASLLIVNLAGSLIRALIAGP
jgi:hypothetical protein